MSCRRRTKVLRIPASALGFTYRREWNQFLNEHDDDFQWEPGFFAESMSDEFPSGFRRRGGSYKDPDERLDQRDPKYPEIIPGPFLDYYLDEIIPLPVEEYSYGKRDQSRPLTGSEAEAYLPLYQRLFPRFTLKDMEAVRLCEYEWYDGSDAPYFYSELD